MAKSTDPHHGKEFLQNSFWKEQKFLQVKLELASQSIVHAGTMGAVNEEHFVGVLRNYLPKRYAADSGIIIDSTGTTSQQIDAVVYDPQYTPTLLDQENHRYIPAEAVYAVLEVKPTINKQYLDYAGDKAASVRVLRRTSVAIAHAGGEYPPKTLFPLVAGIVASKIDWFDGFKGTTFRSNHSRLTDNRFLDCGLAVSGHCFDLFDGEIKTGPGKNALAYFLFRLLQKLQSLGTVPAIDWNAYAEALGN